MARFFNAVDEYPGIYSFKGVNAIKIIVPKTRQIEERVTIIKALSRVKFYGKSFFKSVFI